MVWGSVPHVIEPIDHVDAARKSVIRRQFLRQSLQRPFLSPSPKVRRRPQVDSALFMMAHEFVLLRASAQVSKHTLHAVLHTYN